MKPNEIRKPCSKSYTAFLLPNNRKDNYLKKYNIILADPPWQYGNPNSIGAPEKHYPTMPLQDICALPIKDLADDDCALFLWATMPFLRESFEVIDAWGFKYITAGFVWLKTHKHADGFRAGLGYWTRANAEICLLAKKGRPKRHSTKVRQVIEYPVEGHSKKPDETRERIVELMGDVPRVELFARQKAIGWDVWGNELPNDIEISSDLS